MSNFERYNNWANFPTWCVKLWIDNDQGMSESVSDQAGECESVYDFAQAIESYINDVAEMQCEGLFASGFVTDLFTFATGMVDYYEIAEALLEDLNIETNDDGSIARDDDEDEDDDDDEAGDDE